MTSHETSARRKGSVDESSPGAERWLAEHGDALYRYARRRVGKREVAEDLVQETFLAAIKSPEPFRGGASVRTWLVSILRRKIVDHHRRVSLARARSQVDGPADAPGFFSQDGSFLVAVARWRTPPEIMEDREFWSVLEGCLARLPKTLASAFVLRELEDLETAELREILDLSPGNLRVRLFRARQLLRECLERRWFGVESQK